MKYKSYEDSAVQNTTGLNLELLGADDVISARTTNRPIANLYENQESNYNLIQTLLKSVYGNVNGIIPDVLESFAPEDFAVGSFKNDTGNYFLRIPTGMALFRNDLDDSKITTTDGNPFSKKGEYNYKDEIHKSNFLQDSLRSYVIENKPEINLYERELAKLIDLDLTDSTNDIKIFCDINEFTYKVAVIDNQTGIQKLDASGSPVFVTDENSNIVYRAADNNGEYNITGVSDGVITNIAYDKNIKENKETPSNINCYIVTDGQYALVPAVNGQYTSDVDKALKATDVNDNYKYKTGYYMKVVRSTSADDEITYLPNKAENAKWEVCLPNLNAAENDIIKYILEVKNGNKVIEKVDYLIIGKASVEDVNSKLYSNILSLSTVLKAERFSKNDNSDIVSGVRILCSSSNSICNNYDLTISIIRDSGEEIVTDYITKQKIENIKATPATKQKYYDNIFELTNAFLGYYSSYLIKIESIYDYINLESIIRVPYIPSDNSDKEYYIYYDLNSNLDNGILDSYDKTGRFYISSNKVSKTGFVKMFRVVFGKTAIRPNNVNIKEIETYLPTLDRRAIYTKRAELNSLDVNARTEIKNYLHIKDLHDDGTSCREIEITEYDSNSNNDQMRISSPVLRLIDSKDDELKEAKVADNWSDTGNGDTISDFYEEPVTVRNFKDNTVKYLHHKDSNNKGIIIDKNKGIKIFNNDVSTLDEETRSYSSYKPIEIVSKKGNINIFRSATGNTEDGRINISNLADSANNIIDLKGITRIRSKNENQLVLRKIGDFNNVNNKSSIAFSIGNSTPLQNKSGANDENNDLFVGSLEFYSGDSNETIINTDKERTVNENNRFASIKISNIDGKNPKNAVVFRSAKSGDNKKIMTMYGDIVPYKKENNYTIGVPLKSRTYIEDLSPVISYISERESTLNVDSNGNSTDYVNNEGRWLAAFLKRGYIGHLTLADTTDDIKNNDSREGALRLGNSNIYDISSIYINCDNTSGVANRKNFGTINFDNESGTENTIYSRYNDNNKVLSIILNRNFGAEPSINTCDEKINNAAAILFKPTGTEIRKNTYIRRQEFVNTHTNSTTEDNSSLVVKGQSVLNGELVVGKNTSVSKPNESVKDVIKTIDYTSDGEVTANKSDDYKSYNWEYFGIGETAKIDYSNKSFPANCSQGIKDRILFVFRNYGRSYFDGDITLSENSKFTEKTTFNKSVIINNNNYATYAYNEQNGVYCPVSDDRYVASKDYDLYYNPEGNKKLPRHNISLDIVSGKVIFGSATSTDSNDKSDFELHGSQYISRRLEVGTGTKGPILFDTYQNDNVTQRLILDGYVENNQIISSKTSKESPTLYIEGASQFSGDVVFGHKLNEEEITNDSNKIKSTLKYLQNKKVDIDDSLYNPIKVIFWGNNIGSIEKSGKFDYKSDFDFHGKTWFDNTVRIGTPIEDINRINSNETDSFEEGSLDIFGKDADVALNVSGNVSVGEGHEFTVESEYVSLRGFEGANYAYIKLNKESSGNANIEATNDVKISSTFVNKAAVNNITLNDEGIELYSNSKSVVSKVNNNTLMKLEPNGATLQFDSNKGSFFNTTNSIFKYSEISKLTLDNTSSELVGGFGETTLKLTSKKAKLQSIASTNLELGDSTAKLQSDSDVFVELKSNQLKVQSDTTHYLDLNNSTSSKLSGGVAYVELSSDKATIASNSNVNIGLREKEIKITSGAGTATFNSSEASMKCGSNYIKLCSTSTSDYSEIGYGTGTKITLDSSGITLKTNSNNNGTIYAYGSTIQGNGSSLAINYKSGTGLKLSGSDASFGSLKVSCGDISSKYITCTGLDAQSNTIKTTGTVDASSGTVKAKYLYINGYKISIG